MILSNDIFQWQVVILHKRVQIVVMYVRCVTLSVFRSLSDVRVCHVTQRIMF